MNPKEFKQIKIIYASFAYLALVIERNENMPKRIKEIYKKTAKVSHLYRKHMDTIINSINKDISGHEVIIIDELLASIAILAHYKEKVQNRLFEVVKWSEINEIMDALIADIKDSKKVNRTLDYSEYVVDSILSDNGNIVTQ